MKLFYEIIHFEPNVDETLSPIIFIHGLAMWRKSWKVVGPRIARRTRRLAFAIDARNHGESPWSHEMSIDAMVEDLLEFMDDHHIKRAVLVSHSMGGRTAICFSLKYPERVESLVVEDMVPSNVKTKDHYVHKVIKALKNEVSDAITTMEEKEAQAALTDLMLGTTSDKLINHEKLKDNLFLDVVPVRKVGGKCVFMFNAEVMDSMLEKDFLVQNLPEQGRKFKGRTLFLFGSKPFFKVRTDDAISRLFPFAIRLKVEGASHGVHIEFPDNYVEVVSNFISTPDLYVAKY